MAKPRIIKEVEAIGNDFDRHWQLIDMLSNLWRWPDYIRFDINEGVLSVSTGGLSDHERIIEALEKTKFWTAYWLSSKRGGHYEFDISKIRKPQ